MKTQVPVVMGHARSFTFWSCLLPSFSAPLLFPYFTCIAMLFYHLVPSTWHPASSLSNKYSSLILEVSSQTGWTWQSNLRPSSPPWQSNLPDNAQNVTPSHTPELLRRKLPPLLFHSHWYTLLFSQFFHCIVLNPCVFLPHVQGNPWKEGTRDHLISLYLVDLVRTVQVLSLECRQESKSAVHRA